MLASGWFVFIKPTNWAFRQFNSVILHIIKRHCNERICMFRWAFKHIVLPTAIKNVNCISIFLNICLTSFIWWFQSKQKKETKKKVLNYKKTSCGKISASFVFGIEPEWGAHVVSLGETKKQTTISITRWNMQTFVIVYPSIDLFYRIIFVCVFFFYSCSRLILFIFNHIGNEMYFLKHSPTPARRYFGFISLWMSLLSSTTCTLWRDKREREHAK